MTAPRTAAYTCEAQQRIFKLFNLLWGHEVAGVTPDQLVRETGIPAATITRDIANLLEAGVAERLPDSKAIRIAPHICQKAIRTLQAIDEARTKLDVLTARYGTR